MPPTTTTTIFFSANGTLRSLVPDAAAASQAASGILRLTQTRETWESLSARLEDRWEVYRQSAESALLEAGDRELWTKFLLPEYEPNMIFANAPSLSRVWLGRGGRWEIRSGMADVLRELCRRGYTLGILENTPSGDELPEWLVAEGLVPCFGAVLLSGEIRLRKPDPAAYRLAARCAGVPVRECAFVGGAADIAGAAAAGFGMTVLMEDGVACRGGKALFPAEAAEPSDLLNLFPDRRDGGTVYHADGRDGVRHHTD